MKWICLMINGMLLFSGAMAQSTVINVDYQKTVREALQNEIGYPEKTVSYAIDETMSKMGIRGKSNKGFTVYRGVVLPDLGGNACDLYFSVDRKSKKEKESSLVTLMISKGGEDFITDSSDAILIGKAKSWLDSLVNRVAVYDLEQQIKSQVEMVKKNEKKIKNLQEDGNDLEKKRKKTEEEINNNNKAQVSQQAELENQQTILETLKGKRKQ